VDTIWRLELPKAANPFDYSTIADVLLTLEYTALNSFDYRQQVIQTLDPELSVDRPFSFRQEFPDQWYELNNPDQTETPMVARFETTARGLPAEHRLSDDRAIGPLLCPKGLSRNDGVGVERVRVV
jgi:receptor-binding and translocation channel-forming TcA subunit of Tc toxin